MAHGQIPEVQTFRVDEELTFVVAGYGARRRGWLNRLLTAVEDAPPTVEAHLALAVLEGDKVAVNVLMDKLQESRA